jgi:hypothetical protein
MSTGAYSYTRPPVPTPLSPDFPPAPAAHARACAERPTLVHIFIAPACRGPFHHALPQHVPTLVLMAPLVLRWRTGVPASRATHSRAEAPAGAEIPLAAGVSPLYAPTYHTLPLRIALSTLCPQKRSRRPRIVHSGAYYMWGRKAWCRHE